jgi:chemotaxis protein CheC
MRESDSLWKFYQKKGSQTRKKGLFSGVRPTLTGTIPCVRFPGTGRVELFEKLDEKGLDVLREICSIGAGHAATALSQMTGRKIVLEVPKVSLVPFSHVPGLMGGAEKIVAGLSLRILGQARGNIFLVFPRESALAVLSLLGLELEGVEGAELEGELAQSSLKEVGNILASSYLTAINQLTGLVMLPSVPSFAYDMAGSIVDYVLIEVGRISDAALVVDTVFLGAEDSIMGHFFLLPDPHSLEVILRTVSGEG